MRDQALLEFDSIGNKGLQRYGKSYVGVGKTILAAVLAQGKDGVGVVKAAGEALGLKQHAPGHPVTPALHGSTEDTGLYVTFAQMRSDRQAVWARSQDGNIGHWTIQGILQMNYRSSETPAGILCGKSCIKS